jgi:anaerobic C4-dicarboxylate transporter DcuA
MILWLQLAVLLAALLIGAKLGGIGLGAMGGMGLFLLVFGFGLPAVSPPWTVVGMILAIVSALSLVEAAGGLDVAVRLAERVLRRNPRRVTLVAPLVTYLLVFASGTQHVIYALLPVIAEVARMAGIRPERPLSASVIASEQGLVASPISAATVTLAATLSGSSFGLPQILMVIIPSTLAGLAAGTLAVAFRGTELADDPEYRRRLAEGKVASPGPLPELDFAVRKKATGSCVVFLIAVAGVVLLGMFPWLRPRYENAPLEMGATIMMVMLAAAGLVAILFRADPEKAIKGSVMKGGLAAVIAILGLTWMGSSFFEGNKAEIVGGMSALVRSYPWAYAAGLFTLSVLLFSQSATVATLGPVGAALGLPPTLLLGSYPAVNGLFFLPTYGTVLAAVAFDTTGTTRIGRRVLNHSFMRPGLVATGTATVAAIVLARSALG